MASFTPRTQRDKMMVFVTLLAAVMVVVYWQFVYAPKTAELAQVESHIESLQGSNHRAKAEMAKGDLDDLRGGQRSRPLAASACRQLVVGALDQLACRVLWP